MFLSRDKKNNIYPFKPQFYYIEVGFKGVKIIQACFRDGYCYSDDLSVKNLTKVYQPLFFLIKKRQIPFMEI